jgi:cytochrome c
VAAGERFQYDGAALASRALALHGDSMKFTHVVIAAGMLAAGAVQAQDAAELLKKYGCVACHANDKKVVGPAYVEVAAKYKGDAGAAAKLAAKVKAGGQGVWGPVPMPPNPSVPDADMKAMIAYILALKK